MLREERHRYILDRINQESRVYLTRISEELGVSDDTIRRDLAELDREGLLTKVHGGAIAKAGLPLGITDRLQTNTPETTSLADKAIGLFNPGDSLLIDGSAANLSLARQLPGNIPYTVFTNSFPVANALMDHPLVDLVFLGGTVSKASAETVGIPVFQALQGFRVDWLVLGVNHVHPQRGLTVADREEALLKKQMIDQAAKVVILADSAILNTAKNCHVASLEEVDFLLVDDSELASIRKYWPGFSFTLL